MSSTAGRSHRLRISERSGGDLLRQFLHSLAPKRKFPLLLALCPFSVTVLSICTERFAAFFGAPPLGWRNGEDRPPGHGIVRQAPRDSADAPGQILGPRGKRQVHAAHIYESTPGLARGTRVKDAELDEIAHSLGFAS